MNKIKIMGLAIALGLFVGGTAMAQATDTSQTKNKNLSNCSAVQANMGKRISNFENAKDKKFKQYDLIQDKAVALATKLENEGYDVSQIRVDLVTLDQKIVKFKTDYATYVSSLVETKTFTCSRSAVEFRAKLAITRTQLSAVKEDAAAIRTFWTETLKPSYVAAKLQTITVEEGN